LFKAFILAEKIIPIMIFIPSLLEKSSKRKYILGYTVSAFKSLTKI